MVTTRNRSDLEQAFLEDHRHLTRGLSQLLAALRDEDLPRALEVGDRLDRAVGPHMEFEEHHFYPRLSIPLGESFTSRLYGEHEVGRRALVALLTHAPDDQMADSERHRLIRDFDETLEHALSCGTLLSHVANLDASERNELTDRLLELRARPRRWTDPAD